jgi:hypothetical protein
MAKFSEAEKAFLKFHKIPLSDVMDVEGMRPREYEPLMKEKGLNFCIGATKCRKSGHRIRSRSGKCIQCHTSAISYMLRWGKGGIVYLAYSNSALVAKIGITSDIDKRLGSLISESYGNITDWEMFYSQKVSNAAQVEDKILSLLDKFKDERKFDKNGKIATATECFKCPRELALETMDRCIGRRSGTS